MIDSTRHTVVGVVLRVHDGRLESLTRGVPLEPDETLEAALARAVDVEALAHHEQLETRVLPDGTLATIYLGLVPYPGKDAAESDLEAARGMIDLLSMLEDKTRGNLDPEEARLLKDLIYTYRLEFVRLRSGGGAR